LSGGGAAQAVLATGMARLRAAKSAAKKRFRRTANLTPDNDAGTWVSLGCEAVHAKWSMQTCNAGSLLVVVQFEYRQRIFLYPSALTGALIMPYLVVFYFRVASGVSSNSRLQPIFH
jgi:hypothetical protein